MGASSPQVVVDGRYRVLSVLGEGASAVVYLAVQPPIGRQVAIKVLRSEVSGTDELATRTLREAKVIGSLKHPNIVTVHDYGMIERRPYVVMEFVRGPTLARVLDGQQRLEPSAAIAVFEQIASALSCAHRKGIVHRDIKPANILLDRRTGDTDTVKVADFGVATTASSELTQAGSMIGTPAYMSPEQARGEPVDQRSDLYSLGVLMYRALVGRKPFTPTDPLAMALCHVSEPVPTFAEVDPAVEIPAALEYVVRRCLAKDPDQRYATAEDLLVDLEGFRLGVLAPEPTGGFTIEHADLLTLDEPPPRRQAWVALVGAAGLAGAVVALALLAWMRPAEVAPEPIPLSLEAPVHVVAQVEPVEAVHWGERPVKWRGSIDQRVFGIDLAPMPDGTLTAELFLHQADELLHIEVQGQAIAVDEHGVMLSMSSHDGWVLTGTVADGRAAGTLEGPGTDAQPWVAAALASISAASDAPVEPDVVVEPDAVATALPAVTVQGDASRVFLVDPAGRRTTVPGSIAAGSYQIVAMFGGSEPTPAGRVVVTDQPVTIACSGFAMRCKVRGSTD